MNSSNTVQTGRIDKYPFAALWYYFKLDEEFRLTTLLQCVQHIYPRNIIIIIVLCDFDQQAEDYEYNNALTVFCVRYHTLCSLIMCTRATSKYVNSLVDIYVYIVRHSSRRTRSGGTKDRKCAKPIIFISHL